jgi:hypothetical protein
MPFDAPVTSATLPSSLFVILLSLSAPQRHHSIVQ